MQMIKFGMPRQGTHSTTLKDIDSLIYGTTLFYAELKSVQKKAYSLVIGIAHIRGINIIEFRIICRESRPVYIKLIKLISVMHYSFKSTPTYTFKSRSQTITKSNQFSSHPGPADYQVKKTLTKAPVCAQVKEVRNVFKTVEFNPSPGQYETRSYITAGPKRSMSARYVTEVKATPGPTDYDTNTLKVLNKSPVFSLAHRSKSSHQLIFETNDYKPAPGAYESKTSFAKKNGPFVGNSKRKDLTETEKTPAPNHYASGMAADYASVNNPRCRIGSEQRKTSFNKAEETPGPAVYDQKSFIQENLEKKKGYSCRQKTANLIALELSKFPGPGDYESHLRLKTNAPRQTQTQTERKTFMDDMEKSRKQLPGPGYHETPFQGTKYRSTSAHCFTRSARKPLDENEKTPGPVMYQNDKISLLNTAPRFSSGRTIAKQEFLSVNPQNPGPGHYNSSVNLTKSNSQMYQIPHEQRPNFDKERFTPGAGYYNLRTKSGDHTAQWRFPMTKRIAFTDMKSEAKDGNLYDIGSKVVDPPKYMRVESKIQYPTSKDNFKSTGRTRA